MINEGYFTLRDVAADPASTVIVTGIGRSGTSAAASVLYSLGIPMGDSWAEGLFEDQHLNHAIVYFDHVGQFKLIEERNQAHALWGVKIPGAHNYWKPPELRRFKNARVICMSRDLTALVNRVLISDRRTDASALLMHLANEQTRLIEFLLRAEVPVMFVSYEKMLKARAACVGAIAAFCDLSPNHTALMAAMKAIEPDNPTYLKTFHPEAA